MDIVVDRFYSHGAATLAKVFVDGDFICFGLEDEKREVKVAGKTRIPAGQYSVAVRTHGGYHQRHSTSRHYRDYHRGMLEVMDVPNFTDILIHTGNTDEHTQGCLLVGMSHNQGKEFKTTPTIGASRSAYKKLYLRVIDAAECGGLTITYQDND